MLRSVISIMTITMLIVMILFVTGISLYGDPSVHTIIKVDRLATDNRETAQSLADLVQVVSDTVAQFGFREEETGNSNIAYTDLVAGENPKIWLDVYRDELPVKLIIKEKWIDLRTHKHRNLVNALITNLIKAGFDAAVTDHSRDYRPWCWFVSAALFVVAVLLIRRRT